jgi:hypothetical protein
MALNFSRRTAVELLSSDRWSLKRQRQLEQRTVGNISKLQITTAEIDAQSNVDGKLKNFSMIILRAFCRFRVHRMCMRQVHRVISHNIVHRWWQIRSAIDIRRLHIHRRFAPHFYTKSSLNFSLFRAVIIWCLSDARPTCECRRCNYHPLLSIRGCRLRVSVLLFFFWQIWDLF